MKPMVLACVCALLVFPTLVHANGKNDYNAYCAGCHGANGNVQTEKAKALNMDVKTLALKVSRKDKNEMVAIVEKGKAKMPSYEKQLTKKQISDIVDYAMALRKK